MDQLGIEKNINILADYSRPETIAEIDRAGYYIENANKVVKQGIDNIKTFGIFCEDHPAIKKEYENYKWKKIGDQITDEPVKLWDDAMDAIRRSTSQMTATYPSN
jgi:hypothetical protein